MTTRRLVGMVLAFTVSAGAAAASDYSDFRIPAHSTSRLGFSIGGIYSPTTYNQFGSQQESKNGQASASGSWGLGHDSERLQYSLLIAGGTQGVLAQNDLRTEPPAGFENRHEQQERRAMFETWLLQGALQSYPTRHAWAIGAGVTGSGGYTQEWDSQTQIVSLPPDRTEDRIDRESWTYRYQVDASVHTGWGRVRDATGVHQVQFIENRLIGDGVLTGPLQQATRQKLAEQFYMQLDFAIVHHQPERFFWSEFERILREDPALRPDVFNAYAVMHAADRVAVADHLDRRVGVFVGPLITLRHENVTVRSQQRTSSLLYSNDVLVSGNGATSIFNWDYDEQRALGGVQIAVEQPLGIHWHLSASAIGQCDLRGFDEFAELRSVVTLRYWGGERWYAETNAAYGRMKDDRFYGLHPRWDLNWGGTVSYYLEDHVSIDAGVGQYQYHSEYTFQRNGFVSLGLSYRRGTLTAPGTIGKVRPI